MTINSLTLVHSTPFVGLGTQTFNVVTTGLYTVAPNVTIPWMAGGPPSVAPTGNVQTVTTVADSAGSLNSTFWLFGDAGDAYQYYVWYNINSAGVDPAVAGRTGIQVAGATNATANTLATATRAAINAATGVAVTASGATNAVILTNDGYGSTTAAANGTASPAFGYSTGTAGTFGTSSGLVIQVKLQGVTMLTLSNPTPTQPMMAGSVRVQATAGDVITVVMSSLSAVDAALNAVKGVINLYAGV